MFDFRSFSKKCLDNYIEAEIAANRSTEKLNILKNIQLQNYFCVYTSHKKCRDNFVGCINTRESQLFIQKEFRFNNRRKLLKRTNTKLEKIVVLMESPHRDEFGVNLTAPALGETGERLNTYLPKILLANGLLSSKNTEIYLVNTIPYQCSLGFETKFCRDIIFEALWKNKRTKKSLFRRLERISPTVILVAMTAIKNGKYKSEIINLLKDKEYSVWSSDTHPSQWNKNTKITHQ